MVGVGDGNDHNLSVWEWENKKKVAEAKVRLFFIVQHFKNEKHVYYCTNKNAQLVTGADLYHCCFNLLSGCVRTACCQLVDNLLQ